MDCFSDILYDNLFKKQGERTGSMDLKETREWKALKRHYDEMKDVHIRDLFKADPERSENFIIEDLGLYVDFSRNIITKRTMDLLIRLAEARGLPQAVEDMFEGRRINVTENRPALHIALRNRSNMPIYVDGRDVMQDVNAVLRRMIRFSDEIRSGKRQGFTGKRIRNVVNIGIGGSDLGPKAVCKALSHYCKEDQNVFFLSNIDPDHITEILKEISWEETLFIVASKTFSTLETITNAQTAKKWIIENAGDERAVGHHFAATTANRDAALGFGIDSDNIFLFWDWVGGRYSLCSAIGLPIMIAIGAENFTELLDGFHEMDNHFRYAPLKQNIPVILGLIGVWYINFFGAQTHAVIPYSYHLRELVLHLQQLDMESNGKGVDKEGNRLDYDTGPIIWGDAGTNCQHAFFQLLHQGTRFVPVDFIGFFRALNPISDHHKKLIANMIAQAEALAFGKEVDAPPYRRFPGNRPSNIIMADKLTPSAVGKLIALYEHKVFVQAAIWGINPFDQWGVELGKELATKIVHELCSDSDKELSHDTSTNRLIKRLRSYNSYI